MSEHLAQTALIAPGDPGCPFELTAAGLVVHGTPTIDEYRTMALGLGQTERRLRWVIGDLLIACECHHGEQYAQLAADFGLSAKSLMHCKSLALRFGQSRRRDCLSWEHHAEVAPLDEPQQDALLLRAEAEEWSRNDLRKAVREEQGVILTDPAPDPGTPAGHVPCPTCGGAGHVPEPESDGEVLLTYPCNGQPPEWVLLASQVEQWRALYPGLDVEGECRKALAWIEANSRKTARGMARFLVNWLNRANDRPRTGPGTGAAPTPRKETVAEKIQRISGGTGGAP